MGSVAPWTARLWELVREGPQPYDHALVEMARLVPPGRAFRNTKRLHDWQKQRFDREDHERSPHLSKPDKEALIRQGKIALARSAIWTQTRRGRVDEYYDDGVRMLREGPFPSSGPSAHHPHQPPKAPWVNPNRLSPATRFIWRRVAQGPISRADLIEEALPFVAEADALHDIRTAYQSVSRRRKSPVVEGDRASLVRAGRLRSVRRALADLVKNRRLCVYGEGDTLMIGRGDHFWTQDAPDD